jgi:hypothetical protein
MRNAESTSLMRAVGFRRIQVSRFSLSELQGLMKIYSFAPPSIFDSKEMGISYVHINSGVVLEAESKWGSWHQEGEAAVQH